MAIGRHTKLVPEVHKRIVTYLSAGNYIETAAAAAGIDKQTLYNWLRRGAEETEGIYREFSADCEAAMASAETASVARIRLAAERHWQAAAWYLERKHPDRWGLRAMAEARESSAEEFAARIREAAKLMRQTVTPAAPDKTLVPPSAP